MDALTVLIALLYTIGSSRDIALALRSTTVVLPASAWSSIPYKSDDLFILGISFRQERKVPV